MARPKLLARLVKRLKVAKREPPNVDAIYSLSTGKRMAAPARLDELEYAARLSKARLGLVSKPEPIVDELAQSVRLPTVNRRV